MWTSKPPAISAAEVANSCIRGIRDAKLRSAVDAAMDTIESNSASFHALGETDQLHQINRSSHPIPDVSDDQMRWLYSQRLTKSAKGRRSYDQIMSSAPFGLCLYCKQSDASTLDHFVPKHQVGSFAIEPSNLVPACPACNHTMGSSWGESRGDQMLHPYFQSDIGRWLQARVEHTAPVVVTFIAQPDASLAMEMQLRVKAQFEQLDLDVRFSKLSSSDISGLCRTLRETCESAADVRDLVEQLAAVAFNTDLNDRRGAMYEALSADDWFCEEGYFTS